MAEPLVSVRGLKVHFPIHGGLLRRRVGVVKAVDGVSFDVQPGETLGLVGESGCGKSTTAHAVLRLLDLTEGSIRIEGTEIGRMPQAALRPLRPRMQMVFGDPRASLDPRMTVEAIIREPLDEQTRLAAREKRERVAELMDAVGLPRGIGPRLPQALSDEQRQRIGIARALALGPGLVVCDEPVAALDRSVQARVANLLEDLQAKRGLAYLFISRDLSMVRHIASRVAVMHLGRIVELQGRERLDADPLHPYTRALLSAASEPDPVAARARQRIALRGDAPSPADPPRGCNFCTRCPEAMPVCREIDPATREVAPGRWVACHLHDPAILVRPDARPTVVILKGPGFNPAPPSHLQGA
ncbi:ABC transporter ATP-binding protein [Rubellimicrobium roseum]|uniref:ABC transporter ATP-binding protein n=1 Tax=Rubellimicrobium roseum TaxID=687525 RepID=A0A5C4NIB4_9RHOB|nr:ABC transporter ATP-binding protein [Rubellimicrobium roseum]TNC73852.1 ABC transporter ATP-binding protein [Rubellimicrobium roseum]